MAKHMDTTVTASAASKEAALAGLNNALDNTAPSATPTDQATAPSAAPMPDAATLWAMVQALTARLATPSAAPSNRSAGYGNTPDYPSDPDAFKNSKGVPLNTVIERAMPNPKRYASDSWHRYNTTPQTPFTIQEAIKAGSTSADALWNIRRGLWQVRKG